MLSKNLTIPMIIEIIFLIVHTPPFFNNMTINYRYKEVNIEEDIPIYIDLFISAFILTRIYLLFKFYANYSKWGGVFASMVCSECNAKGGFHFTYKAGIKERSFTFVIIIMGFTILIFGYALRNSEISFVRYVPEKYFQDWTRIINGFWFMTTNILLLGYGDYYPTTLLGRIIAFCTCIWGIILEGILIKAIIEHLKMESKEEAAYNEVEQYLEECCYKKTALKLINQVYITHKFLENLKMESNMKKGDLKDELFKLRKLKFNRAIWKLKKALREFSLMRKNKEKNEREISVQKLMTKINLEINDNTNYLLRNIQTQINALLENINQAQENAISKMKASKLIGVIEESKNTYVRENLSIHLHESQIKLLKNIKKHNKPHHKKIRIKYNYSLGY